MRLSSVSKHLAKRLQIIYIFFFLHLHFENRTMTTYQMLKLTYEVVFEN